MALTFRVHRHTTPCNEPAHQITRRHDKTSERVRKNGAYFSSYGIMTFGERDERGSFNCDR